MASTAKILGGLVAVLAIVCVALIIALVQVRMEGGVAKWALSRYMNLATYVKKGANIVTLIKGREGPFCVEEGF